MLQLILHPLPHSPGSLTALGVLDRYSQITLLNTSHLSPRLHLQRNKVHSPAGDAVIQGAGWLSCLEGGLCCCSTDSRGMGVPQRDWWCGDVVHQKCPQLVQPWICTLIFWAMWVGLWWLRGQHVFIHKPLVQWYWWNLCINECKHGQVWR